MDGSTTGLRVKRLTGAIGGEVSGLDLRHLDEATFAAIRAAFHAHCMLVFRGQFLEPDELADFGRRWGELAVTPFVTYLPDHPGVLPLDNRGKQEAVTENWHYDSTFLPAPHALSVLSARDVPEAGGDTMWCNQYLAWETLSPGMQDIVGRLKAKFTGARLAKLAGKTTDIPFAIHPVARTHPETGRKALYIGRPGDTVPHFDRMTPEESLPLLDWLYRHSTQPDRIYRHAWRNGDVVMWDNRCTMHYAVHDHGEATRSLHRVTVKGTVPV